MILKVEYSSKFLKQYRLAKKRGIDLTKIDTVITLIASQKRLDAQYKDHILIGNYSGLRECHVFNDYLLVYAINDTSMCFKLLGIHSDLF